MDDLRKMCMCAYFPNTIEPCRKSIRDRELIETFASWLFLLKVCTRSVVRNRSMYHVLMIPKSKAWVYRTNNAIVRINNSIHCYDK